MTERNLKRAVLLFAGAVIGGGIYFLMRGDNEANSRAEPGEDSVSAPGAPLHETNAPTQAPGSPGEIIQNEAASRAPSSEVDAQQAPELAAPRCASDADCRGSRTADCIKTVCEAGSCHNDESACGCSSHADCKDDKPCTRDHCFARTKQCVFIPIDGCK